MQKMMTMLVAAALCVAAAGPVWAVDYTADGRVIMESATYAGPGLDAVDWAVLGGVSAVTVAVLCGSMAMAPSVMAVGVAGVLTYGAWRTAQYRPQDVKDRIHANLEAKRAQARPGTVGSVLGR